MLIKEKRMIAVIQSVTYFQIKINNNLICRDLRQTTKFSIVMQVLGLDMLQPSRNQLLCHITASTRLERVKVQLAHSLKVLLFRILQ